MILNLPDDRDPPNRVHTRYHCACANHTLKANFLFRLIEFIRREGEEGRMNSIRRISVIGKI